ncbi:MAG TPA: (d)CMP kinase [Acidimicrobiia bacterium]
MVVVAIDGPSGVGKSTVARAVADALGIAYLDTGAYYRMATLVALRAGVEPDDGPGILRSLEGVQVDYDQRRLLLDGADVSGRLRSAEVTAAVSAVSAHPAVRSAVVEMQRLWVARHGGEAVVEGRDIGTAVFPGSPVKVFLTADAETRARRRAGDRESAGKSIEALVDAMGRRDAADSSREASPLRPADDAVTIDTSHLTVAEVVAKVLDLVGKV